MYLPAIATSATRPPPRRPLLLYSVQSVLTGQRTHGRHHVRRKDGQPLQHMPCLSAPSITPPVPIPEHLRPKRRRHVWRCALAQVSPKAVAFDMKPLDASNDSPWMACEMGRSPIEVSLSCNRSRFQSLLYFLTEHS